MKAYVYLSLLTILSYYTNGCKKQATQSPLMEKTHEMYSFMDSSQASLAIVEDKMEGFFDRISVLDMQIQSRNKIDCSTRENCLSDYKKFIQSDVEDFNSKEKTLMTSVMDSAVESIKTINPEFINFPIRLAKLKGKHYGDGVYFTRDDVIYIPKNELNRGSQDKLYSIMLHEIYHIASRFDSDFRQNCYEAIGFKKLDNPLFFPDVLKHRLLTNPDGVTDAYVIDLKNDEIQTRAIPLIISNASEFDPKRQSFFEYLKFDLYEIQKTELGYEVLTNSEGFTKIRQDLMNDFFYQIKNNTQYIIHPDEILADNFMLCVMAKQTEDYSGFSEDGRKLIATMEALIRSVN